MKMPTDTGSTSRLPGTVGESRAKWSGEEEKMMTDTMVQEVREGYWAQSGFNLRSLTRVQEAIQDNLQVTYSIQQIGNKCSQVS